MQIFRKCVLILILLIFFPVFAVTQNIEKEYKYLIFQDVIKEKSKLLNFGIFEQNNSKINSISDFSKISLYFERNFVKMKNIVNTLVNVNLSKDYDTTLRIGLNQLQVYFNYRFSLYTPKITVKLKDKLYRISGFFNNDLEMLKQQIIYNFNRTKELESICTFFVNYADYDHSQMATLITTANYRKYHNKYQQIKPPVWSVTEKLKKYQIYRISAQEGYIEKYTFKFSPNSFLYRKDSIQKIDKLIFR